MNLVYLYDVYMSMIFTTIADCVLPALSYPKAILSRAMNYETKEMFTYVSFLLIHFRVSKEIFVAKKFIILANVIRNY